MKNIYQIFDTKQLDGAWFKKFEVPDDLDLPSGYVGYDPPENLINPRFIFGKGWVEDKDSIIEELAKKNKELQERQIMSEEALLELAGMILTR